MSEQTLASVFLDCVRQRGDAEALRYPTQAGWESLTWNQLEARARELAAGLLALGVGSQDRVAIAGMTSKDWILADLGVLLAGAATTAVYPNTLAAEVAYILADSGSVVAIVDDAAQLAKLEQHRADLPALRAVVLMNPAEPGGLRLAPRDPSWVLSLDDLAARGRQHLANFPGAVDRSVAGVAPDHLSTLIYTSGTTGRPKGVQLTQAHWVHVGQVVEEAGVVKAEYVHFLWLPLAHVFGKLLLATQWRIGFLTVVDGRIERIVDNLAVIRPTFMAAAPRIFEKVHSRVVSPWTPRAACERGCSGGRSRSVSVPCSSSRRGSRSRRRWDGSAASPTGWSSRRSARGWAAGSRRWSAAAPPCPRRSPNGSPPRACRSWRATG